jgi:WW domain
MNSEYKYLKYKKKYTELLMSQTGGTLDADRVCDLIIRKIPLSNQDLDTESKVHDVREEWRDFFTKRDDTGAIAVRHGCIPTLRLINCINTLTLPINQSILYCAFRFGTTKILHHIIKVDGINVNLKNSDGSSPIFGAVYYLDNYFEILYRINLFAQSGGDITVSREISSIARAEKTIPGALPDNWIVQNTPDGHIFYVDTSTNQTQWDRPATLPPFVFPAIPSIKFDEDIFFILNQRLHPNPLFGDAYPRLVVNIDADLERRDPLTGISL